MRDPGKPPVYWLNGLAGTGKSTIAQTIAERTFADGRLGASFFCSRDFEDRSNLQLIFPTLAVQLARTHAEFRSIFIPLVQSDPEVAHESLYSQMSKLIFQPLVKSAISTVIVIDALDECKDEEPASAILSVLGQFVTKIPRVKFFVTGRPEPRIREGFRIPLLAKATDVFILHEVEPGQVNSDIRLFFTHSFTELRQRRHVLDDWPAEGQLDLLCERAGGLFVHAVATVRFIDHRNNNPKRQLDRLLLSPESSAFEGKTKFKVNTTLDLLYMTILHEAFGDDDPEDDPKVRSVLGAVVLSANPLSPSAMAVLLGLDAEDVFPLLSSIHSLLVLREDIDHSVRPFHKSFPDFIVDPSRCTNARFRVRPPDQHTEMLLGCLELMNRRLEQNMCKFPDGVMNSEVDDLKEKTEQYIGKALEYACRSWHKHLIHTSPAQTPEIVTVLHRFLEEKFLFWLEVLSVLGVAREAVDALEATTGSLDVRPNFINPLSNVYMGWVQAPQILDLVGDYTRFVIKFFEVISTSAPHIYISALPLSPQTSIVRELYKQYTRPLARVVRGLPTSWEPVVTAVHQGVVGDAVWSPCNKFIAVTKSTVEIFDATTLKRLSILESPPNPRGPLLSFSPDGRFLTQFNDELLTSWDLQTGGPAGTIPSPGLHLFLSAHSFSSTYSTDGRTLAVTYMRPLAPPAIISTHDLLSRTHVHSYRVPEGSIINPIWTHGKCLRYATRKPGFIIIWEVAFTLAHTPREIESLPVPDEITEGEDFLFLPALSRLAFVLKERVFIWDTKTSKFLLNPSGSGGLAPDPPIRSHFWCRGSFSSDGRFFACLTTPQEVSVWRYSPIGYTLHQRLAFGAQDIQNGPLLSPNGELIIAFASSAIHLWYTNGQDPILSDVPTRNKPLYSSLLEFSPNKTFAAFGFFRGRAVTILDLQSGDERLAIDTGMEVECLGITGDSVVVVSRGKIARWDIPENPASNANANTDDSVLTTAFDHSPLSLNHQKLTGISISPDSSRVLAWGSTAEPSYGGLEIYDVSTGRCVAGVRTHHKLLSAWFTLDGLGVWGKDFNSVSGWKIVEDSESGIMELEALEPPANPPKLPPSKSSSGYEIQQNGWVVGPDSRRLLWMPNHWRLGEWSQTWGGRFLGLGRRGSPEVVILEFFE